MAASQEIMCFQLFDEICDNTVEDFLIGDGTSDDGVLALVAKQRKIGCRSTVQRRHVSKPLSYFETREHLSFWKACLLWCPTCHMNRNRVEGRLYHFESRYFLLYGSKGIKRVFNLWQIGSL